MSWGIKITLLYSGFVLMIVGMVTLSMRQKVDLVSRDYYAQELAFQDKINKQEQTRGLSTQLSWEVTAHTLLLKFPEEFSGSVIQGDVFFFRPSDASMDYRVNIPSDTGSTRKLSISSLKRGLFHMQVSWEANGKKYYNEGTLNIQ